MVHVLGALISLFAAYVFDQCVKMYRKAVIKFRQQATEDDKFIREREEYYGEVLKNLKLLNEIEELSHDIIQCFITKKCPKKGHTNFILK